MVLISERCKVLRICFFLSLPCFHLWLYNLPSHALCLLFVTKGVGGIFAQALCEAFIWRHLRLTLSLKRLEGGGGKGKGGLVYALVRERIEVSEANVTLTVLCLLQLSFKGYFSFVFLYTFCIRFCSLFFSF